MKLSEVNFKRALVVNLGNEKLLLKEGDVIYSEKELSSSSKKPYFKSFTGMYGFFETNKNAIDFLAVHKINVGNVNSLKTMLKDFSVEKLFFSKDIKSLNYSFFDSKYKARITVEQFLSRLKSFFNIKIFALEENGVLYVYIEKS